MNLYDYFPQDKKLGMKLLSIAGWISQYHTLISSHPLWDALESALGIKFLK